MACWASAALAAASCTGGLPQAGLGAVLLAPPGWPGGTRPRRGRPAPPPIWPSKSATLASRSARRTELSSISPSSRSSSSEASVTWPLSDSIWWSISDLSAAVWAARARTPPKPGPDRATTTSNAVAATTARPTMPALHFGHASNTSPTNNRNPSSSARRSAAPDQTSRKRLTASADPTVPTRTPTTSSRIPVPATSPLVTRNCLNSWMSLRAPVMRPWIRSRPIQTTP